MTESVVATGDGIVTQGIARGRDKASLNQDDENSLLANANSIRLRAPYTNPMQPGTMDLQTGS